jgi:hypothetical protein
MAVMYGVPKKRTNAFWSRRFAYSPVALMTYIHSQRQPRMSHSPWKY